MVEKAKNYFLEKKLSLSDIPKAAIIHEGMGITLLFMFWTGCYFIRPSHRLLVPIKNAFPKFVDSVTLKLDRTFNKYREKIKFNRGIFKKWIDSERFIIALGESIVLRNLLRPITVPFKLYATWQIILFLKSSRNEKDDNEKS